MVAHGLSSPAPVQSRLDHLRRRGYITWQAGRARTIRLLKGPELVPVSPETFDWLEAWKHEDESLDQTIRRLMELAGQKLAADALGLDQTA